MYECVVIIVVYLMMFDVNIYDANIDSSYLPHLTYINLTPQRTLLTLYHLSSLILITFHI